MINYCKGYSAFFVRQIINNYFSDVNKLNKVDKGNNKINLLAFYGLPEYVALGKTLFVEKQKRHQMNSEKCAANLGSFDIDCNSCSMEITIHIENV